MSSRRCLAVCASILVVCFPSAAQARNRALLIGASGYAGTITPLRGPANDVAAMAALLESRGFAKDDVWILADPVPEDPGAPSLGSCAETNSDRGCPTYAAIIEALTQLAATTQQDDYVVIYFSGHGIQVPDLVARDEPDGLTEAYLPLDVGQWDPERKRVDNLLTDDDLRPHLQAMRSKGALVWSLFDTCHSGDMSRGAASYGTVRSVRGDVLGIPVSAYEEARKGQTTQASLGLFKQGSKSGFVAFAAAQSDQLALELAFDASDASGNPKSLVMGAMTNALTRALADEPNATYRELAQHIVDIYTSLGTDMPAPYFEGDLDRAVFSAPLSPPVWPALPRDGNLVIPAGELHGISEGATLALVDAGGTGDARFARVVRANANSSVAVPVSSDGRTTVHLDAQKPVRVRLARPGVRSILRVALPPNRDLSSAAQGGWAVIGALRSDKLARRPAIDWVAAGEPADIHLRLRNGRIWLLTQFGKWTETGPRQSPSIAVTDLQATKAALQNNLWRVARSLNLLRLSTSYRRSSRGLKMDAAKGLSVSLFLYRDPKGSAASLACAKEPATGPPEGAVPIQKDALSEFRHCDIIYVVMRNKGLLPVDVTLLYIDADAQIQCFDGWGTARIDTGEQRDRMQAFRVVTIDPQSGASLPVGRERLMVIAVERPERAAIETTFCHLQQKGLDSARAEMDQRGSTNAFADLLEQAGLSATESRGFNAWRPEDLGGVAVQTFNWRVRDDAH